MDNTLSSLVEHYHHLWGVRPLAVDPDGVASERAAPAVVLARRTAIHEALRWGHPAFIAGPDEHLYWAVPLLVNARLDGGLVADAPDRRLRGAKAQQALTQLRELAEQANLTNADLLWRRRQQGLREQARAEAIHEAKGTGGRAEIHAAYLQEEMALVAAIHRGDDTEARRILNRVLVVVYGRAGSDLRALKAFALELTTTMIRTVISGGASPSASAAGLARLAELADLEDDTAVSRWLAATMRDLMAAIRAARTPPTDLAMAEAMAIITRRCAEPLTRDQVAKLCHLSPAHFSRLFHARHGRSFTDALARARCDRAAELLARTDQGLAHIAVACGFADQSHFGKVYRRVMGNTPARHRERLRSL
jgi:AraC-like DNA-binding protein